MRGCLSLRILTQGHFLLQSGWPPSNQYCSRAFFLVLLSWINRERLIHFSRKTGCTKILQVTMKQTCSRTIIFIKRPNNVCSRHLHGVAAPPSHLPWALGLVPLSFSFLRYQIGTNHSNWAGMSWRTDVYTVLGNSVGPTVATPAKLSNPYTGYERFICDRSNIFTVI